ncbi:Uncharacterized protein PECH_000686 [Penicillium ucsense]|uniref:Histone chaperone domain-containing protein n=1 Tax=Penicillium ucsense TaxID=2839758 RepID=A0A8J8W4S5_9EURO|nr:Uncharacterized protein PECM_004963 [Penicillium ucsense]KAF7738411.1 Uncharacterized protein PECH_000686 [Penicillium ucsense]
MSNPINRDSEDVYERESDQSRVNRAFADSSYVTGANQDQDEIVPVQSDDQPVEDPIDPATADTNRQLRQDEREAVNESNIMQGDRLRHTRPVTSNRYNEGPEESDIPEV